MGDDRVAATGGDLFHGQLRDGSRQGDCDVAEADAEHLVGLLDVVGGQPGDRCRPLCIEEQQQAGQTVFGPDGVVVQQAAAQRASSSIRLSVFVMNPASDHVETAPDS